MYCMQAMQYCQLLDSLQNSLNKVNEESNECGLKINIEKTKFLEISKK